jgi:hypothetical protein
LGKNLFRKANVQKEDMMKNWVVTRRPAQRRLDVRVYFKSAPAVMVGVVRLSPEMIILQRVLKPQLVAVFSSVVAVAVVITGYLLNRAM